MVTPSTKSLTESRFSVQMNDLRTIFGGEEKSLVTALLRVLESGHYILGSEVTAFESEWADFVGVRYCLGVASGSDALRLALTVLEVGPGDEVITVANAGGYTTQAILSLGAQPIFIDIDPETLLLDPDLIGSVVSHRTKALVVTHLYGNIVDMPAVMAACGSAGIPVIEDSAQAHGGAWDGKKAGAWGDISCFSFYPTKNLGAMGDAGAVCCNDPLIADKAHCLRQYGWQPKYSVRYPGGMNSRLDEIQAAILRTLLPRLAQFTTQRRTVAGIYRERIEIRREASLPRRPTDAYDVAHLFPVQHPERDRIRTELAQSGIQTDIHYPIPDHLQPGFIHQAKRWGLAAWSGLGALPHTEAACNTVLTLPCHPYLRLDMAEHVSQTLLRHW